MVGSNTVPFVRSNGVATHRQTLRSILVKMMVRFLALGGAVVTLVAGHAAMTKPIPRNAADRVLPEYANGKWVPVADSGGNNSGCS